MGELNIGGILTSSAIQNDGIIKGYISFALDSKIKFRYIISQNQILTGQEKDRLNLNSPVDQTENLVPYLSEIDKKYFIHYQIENEREIKEKEIRTDGQGQINFQSQEEESLPQDNQNIPPLPEIREDQKPIIKLNGANPRIILLNENYREEGAVANDDLDGDLSNRISITDNIDNTKIGTYYVTYQVSDYSGNISSITRTVKVISPDQTSPVITLIGDEIIELKAGEDYQEPGATATDETDGDLTGQIIITDNIDYTKTGIYEVVYRVSDEAGNESIKKRTVKITGGGASIETPTESSVTTKPKGKSGKVSKRKTSNGEKLYSCKDSRAINFSNIGTHNPELCIYQDSQTVTEETQNDAEREKEQKNPSDFSALQKLQEFQEKLQKLQEELKKEEAEKPSAFLLSSQCLNLKSELPILKKYNKDKESNQILQMYLKTYNYNIPVIDGIFGNQTAQALKEFQKDNGLTSDGIFGKEVVEYIDKNCDSIKTREE